MAKANGFRIDGMERPKRGNEFVRERGAEPLARKCSRQLVAVDYKAFTILDKLEWNAESRQVGAKKKTIRRCGKGSREVAKDAMLPCHIVRSGCKLTLRRTPQHRTFPIDADEIVKVGETAGKTPRAVPTVEQQAVTGEILRDSINVERKWVGPTGCRR
jgi:hypothetical protein